MTKVEFHLFPSDMLYERLEPFFKRLFVRMTEIKTYLETIEGAIDGVNQRLDGIDRQLDIIKSADDQGITAEPARQRQLPPGLPQGGNYPVTTVDALNKLNEDLRDVDAMYNAVSTN